MNYRHHKFKKHPNARLSLETIKCKKVKGGFVILRWVKLSQGTKQQDTQTEEKRWIFKRSNVPLNVDA